MFGRNNRQLTAVASPCGQENGEQSVSLLGLLVRLWISLESHRAWSTRRYHERLPFAEWEAAKECLASRCGSRRSTLSKAASGSGWRRTENRSCYCGRSLIKSVDILDDVGGIADVVTVIVTIFGHPVPHFAIRPIGPSLPQFRESPAGCDVFEFFD